MKVDLTGSDLMGRAESFRHDVAEGRFVIETRHRQRAWEVVVEPDPEESLLVVITAYPAREGRL